MAKAFFKDGNATHAMNFIDEFVGKRKLKNEEQSQKLIQIYDKIFGSQNKYSK